MCLLIQGTSAAIRQQLLGTPDLIADIYDYNSDGLGVMLGGGQVQTAKVLPKNEAAAIRAVESMLPDDDRPAAVHWRMKTHGAINLDNCHPYALPQDRGWLMHNGVLHTGNNANPKMSDTWHFINAFMAEAGPDVLHNRDYLTMLGEFIGNNRFAIMTQDGRLSLVNQDQGIEYDGVWFSNTYAWNPGLLIPDYATQPAGAAWWRAWTTGDEDVELYAAPGETDPEFDEMVAAIEDALEGKWGSLSNLLRAEAEFQGCDEGMLIMASDLLPEDLDTVYDALWADPYRDSVTASSARRDLLDILIDTIDLEE